MALHVLHEIGKLDIREIVNEFISGKNSRKKQVNSGKILNSNLAWVKSQVKF